MRARGYKPFGTNLDQDALLDRIIAESKPGTVGVFDLDGCLFDTCIRLVTIFHEFTSVKGAAGRYFTFAERSDFTDWDLKKPLRKYGMPEAEIDAIFKEFIAFWRVRFFSDEYVAWDDPMLGSHRFGSVLHKRDAHRVFDLLAIQRCARHRRGAPPMWLSIRYRSLGALYQAKF